jgi:23S rRNA (uracil1939-C5)-methyltransferase
MNRGEEIVVTPEAFAFEGKSVARVDGLVLFVQGAVPGDRVRARVTAVKSSFAEARTLAVLEQSPLRVTPRCPHFGVCGGCTWQHVTYEAQCAFKRQHVIDALERIGGFPSPVVQPTLGMDEPFYYRNKMEFSFGERWRTAEEMQEPESGGDGRRFALGLHIAGRFDKVLDLSTCWLQSETSVQIVNAVRAFCIERGLTIFSTRTHEGYLRNLVIRESRHTAERMVNVVTRDDRPEIMKALTGHLLALVPSITTVVNNITERKSQVATGDREVVYAGPGFITERIGARTYRISANSFFQTNTLQAERLYDTARRLARLRPADRVYDLYSGTGTIALHVADDVAEVVGVEAAPQAVEDARANAASNNVGNCTFLLGDLKDRLINDTAWLGRHGKPDVMIIDPPRAGMHEKVIRQICVIAPPRIVYVSCNPATQARDLKLLCDGGRYAIIEIQPVDMFPHTYHVENVVSLALSGP